MADQDSPKMAAKTPPCMRVQSMAGRETHMIVPLLIVFDLLFGRMRSCSSSSSGSRRDARTDPPRIGNALRIRRIVPSSKQLFRVCLQPTTPPCSDSRTGQLAAA